MLQRLFSTIISLVVCVAAGAQGTCVINGNIADIKLADGKKIKSVCLTRANELGQPVEVATAKVKKGKYSFRYELAEDEPVLMYTITGFGEGKDIEVFVEPGVVGIETASAMEPCNSTVTGTPANEIYSEYKNIIAKHKADVAAKVSGLSDKEAIRRVEAKEYIKTEAQLIRFLIEHNASPVTPFLIEHTLLSKLTAAYADQMLKTILMTQHNHPYYLSLRNQVLARDMKVGDELPDIALPLQNGENKRLTDFRGKYVVLNFWARDCDKSAGMLAELQNLYDIVKDGKDFVIISFALDSDKTAWENAIVENNVNREGWLHACDGAGAASPAAKLLGVDKTPRIVLVEPEGRIVSLDMEIEEVVLRVEQILSGDLYYLDEEK